MLTSIVVFLIYTIGTPTPTQEDIALCFKDRAAIVGISDVRCVYEDKEGATLFVMSGTGEIYTL